jgi:hypothetical protein
VLPHDVPSPSPCHPMSEKQPLPKEPGVGAFFRAHRSIVVNISHEEDNQMNDKLLTMVEREVLSWAGVTSEPGRFGAPESDHTGILQPAGNITTIKGGN